MRSVPCLLIAFCLPILGACALRGPAYTANARLEYNEAVQQSGRRELLLNLVRLRYLEGPEFLSIGSIASQISFDVAASLGGSFGEESAAATRLSMPGSEVGFSESPIATFTPRQDEVFTRRLVEPIALETLVALTRYGWSLERVLLVAVEEINGVRNVATRETLSPEDRAASERFAALAAAMQALYDRREIDLVLREEWVGVAEAPAERVIADDHLRAAASGYRWRPLGTSSAFALERRERRPVLRVARGSAASEAASVLLETLGLPRGQAEHPFTEGEPTGDAVAVRTRSVLGAMAYLSQGVMVPRADLAAGRAPPEHGVARLLRVGSAPESPAGAAIAVPYARHWFFVDAADLESRRTFGALESLLRLELGAGPEAASPVLTLPLGR